METTIKYLITLESFNIGAASVNFLFNVFTKIGLVRTHSIHYSIQTPYTKSRKSSGLLKEFKTKKPDSKLKSGFLRAGDGTRTRNLLITNQLLCQLSYTSIFKNCKHSIFFESAQYLYYPFLIFNFSLLKNIDMKRNITQNELKLFSSLLQKKFRKQHNLFLVEGSKLVDEALMSRYKITQLLATEFYHSKNKSFFDSSKSKGIEILIVKEKDFTKLSDAKSQQGITAVCEAGLQHKISFKSKVIIALENISDPGNLGTIIRNCDWFGFDNIILSEQCAEVFSPKVLRASMGSVFHTNISIADQFFDKMDKLKSDGYKILVADLNGENLYDMRIDKKSVFVLCNEANGPTKEIKEVADGSITIPRYGQAESLNVASASAVILSHLAKSE